MTELCYKCGDPVYDVGGTQVLDGWVCDDCAPVGTGWKMAKGMPKMTVAQLRELDKPLIERLTYIRDIARSGLPSSELTVEQSQQVKLNEIAGKLTRLIEENKNANTKKETKASLCQLDYLL